MMTLISLLMLSGLGIGDTDQRPASTHAYLANGQRLMEMDRFKEASEVFQHVLAENPNQSQARQQLSICHFELRQYSEARPLFEKMTELNENPSLATYYL